ncbi:hypothetical protein GCM10017781_27900 [Deinococcus metalli]|uniref:Uncharacterized protein n=1 Tax=Deinococcus metalli TaxID=1141878 RepID=A0ABQ3JP94_9DEIO|nr:hypothetical protein GCM10017781_27900 [Deinococcus metalli]
MQLVPKVRLVATPGRDCCIRGAQLARRAVRAGRMGMRMVLLDGVGAQTWQTVRGERRGRLFFPVRSKLGRDGMDPIYGTRCATRSDG